jgi:hypothetical protein
VQFCKSIFETAPDGSWQVEPKIEVLQPPQQPEAAQQQ